MSEVLTTVLSFKTLNVSECLNEQLEFKDLYKGMFFFKFILQFHTDFYVIFGVVSLNWSFTHYQAMIKFWLLYYITLCIYVYAFTIHICLLYLIANPFRKRLS